MPGIARAISKFFDTMRKAATPPPVGDWLWGDNGGTQKWGDNGGTEKWGDNL